MPPTPLRVKPKPSCTAVNSPKTSSSSAQPSSPPGSLVVRMPIALIDTGPKLSSRIPAYSPLSGSRYR